MSDNRPDLPPVNASNFSQRLRETVMTYLGRQGDPLDRGLTVRDMVDAGIVKFASNFGSLSGGGGLTVGSAVGSGGGSTYTPDLTPPPAPASLTATGGFSSLTVTVAAAAYSVGHGHSRTRLYAAQRATGAPAPVVGDAVEIAQFDGQVYAHPSDSGITWHLWAAYESVDGVVGPKVGGLNGVVAVTGQSPATLLSVLKGTLKIDQMSVDPGGFFFNKPTDSTINGVLVPAGTYIDSAYIGNVNALYGRFGTLVSDSIAAASIDAAKITAGFLAAARIQAGTITATHIAANTITGAKIAANTITADKIDSRELTIKDTAGNVLFGSGQNLDFSRIGGATKPANNATKNTVTTSASAPAGPTNGDIWVDTSLSPTVTKVYSGGAWVVGSNLSTNTNQLTDGAGLGNTATWSGVSGAGKPQDNATVGATFGVNVGGQITAGTASTYIADAAIGSAQIGQVLAGNIAVTELSKVVSGGVVTGGRVEVQANKILVYDTTNAVRVKIGYLL